MKLRKEHVAKEWDEGHPNDGGNGYWISLKSGWKWDGDPDPRHLIHDDTKDEAWREGVVPCQCKYCYAAARLDALWR
jgi:hypothetical protein